MTAEEIREKQRKGLPITNMERAILEEASVRNRVFLNVSTQLFEWNTRTRLDVESAYKWAFFNRVMRDASDFDRSVELKQNTEAVLDWLMRDSQMRTDPTITAKPFLFLTGTCGNGKTTTMNAIIDTLRAMKMMQVTAYREEKNPIEIHSFEARELFDMLGSNNRLIEKYTHVDILAIDDLAQEPTSILDFGNPKQPIERLLSERQKRRMKTIITSNLDPGKFGDKYGERLADRFKTSAVVISYTHESYRKQ